ncbi:MAG: hypothetical protein VB018_03280 [Lachnospiraceae bacterium]|nr:hypothetical protein [Lachnospiraceae bacterium]
MKKWCALSLSLILTISTALPTLAATRTGLCVGTDFGYLSNGKWDIDTSEYTYNVNSVLNDLGYRSEFIFAPTASILRDSNLDGEDRLSSDILFLAGHGTADTVRWNYNNNSSGSYLCGVKDGDDSTLKFAESENFSNYYEYNFVGLENYDMDSVRLAMFMACNTAASSVNITSMAVNQYGADVAMGWKVPIDYTDAGKWSSAFFEAVRQGQSIYDSAYIANDSYSYYNPAAITAFQIYAEQYSYVDRCLNNIGEFSLRSNLKSDEDTDKLNIEKYDVDDYIEYSFEDKDTHEIEEYIKNHIDKNFDLDYYNIYQDINIEGMENEERGTVSFVLKVGEFETPIKYRVFIEDGVVKKIHSNGEHSYNDSIKPLRMNHISEDELLETATSNIIVADNESIVKKEIFKKYDTEPYYVVSFTIRNDIMNEEHIESYEHRI